ncbi:polysaccharide pyruvyl transferase family protein [Rhodococcus sp. NPDC057014]|uniref:polysaccharide pyruvyl transferase family protein n=1 Tax=Rhodococcus sp. NPDC057014 TaxID=3346000 RepID=UPI00363A20BF
MLTVDGVTALEKLFHQVGFLSMDQGDSSDFYGLSPAVRLMMEPQQLDYTWYDAAEKIGASTLVISSRMHALYLAGLLNVPSIAVGRSPKVASFAKRYGIPIVEDVADLIERPRDGGIPDFADDAKLVRKMIAMAVA